MKPIACSQWKSFGFQPNENSPNLSLCQRGHGKQSSPSDVGDLGSTGFSQMAHREQTMYFKNNEKTYKSKMEGSCGRAQGQYTFIAQGTVYSRALSNSPLSWEVKSEHLLWALSFPQTIQMAFLAFSSSLALSRKPLCSFHPILKHRVPFFLAKSIPSLGLHSNLRFPTGLKGLTSTTSFVLQTASLTSLRVPCLYPLSGQAFLALHCNCLIVPSLSFSTLCIPGRELVAFSL